MLSLVLQRFDNFLHKAERVHKPLRSFKGRQEYQDLQDELRSAILQQAKAAVQIVNSLPDDLQPINEAQLAQRLERELPSIATLIDKTELAHTLTLAFTHGVKSLYRRIGIRVKAADPIDFQLTNPHYLAQLNSQASYLLNRSQLDGTTVSRLASMIAAGKADAMTNQEVADQISSEFPDIADYRAQMITRTEVARAMNAGDLAGMVENGVPTKAWVAAGNNPCIICLNDESDGYIPVDSMFESGDEAPPAHPNCECYLDAGQINLSLPDLVLWEGE